ncbi:MAG: DUF6265 family protein [Myxococcota bacterium]
MCVLLALTFHLMQVVACATTGANLDWLAGSWGRTVGDKTHEEHWRWVGDRLDGRGCMIRDGQTVFSEDMTVEFRAGGPVFVANPTENPTPNRDPNQVGPALIEFPMTEVGERRIAFENPAHDWPTRIEYWRTGETLHARASGRGQVREWKWTRSVVASKPCAP